MPYISVRKVDFSGPGIYVTVEGEKYPRKGYPQSAFVQATANTKRVVMIAIRLLRNPLIAITAYFNRKRLLHEFISWAEVNFFNAQDQLQYLRELGEMYRSNSNNKKGLIFLPSELFTPENFLDPQYYCTSVREIFRVGMQFVRTKDERKVLDLLCMFLEFDDVYRFRFQDAFGEAKSIRGGMKLLWEREGIGVNDVIEKTRSLVKAFNILYFVFPRFRNMVKRIERDMDWGLIKLDDADFYHALPKGNYKFGGYTFEERQRMREKLDQEYWNEVDMRKKGVSFTNLGK